MSVVLCMMMVCNFFHIGIKVSAMKPNFLCLSFLKDEVWCAIWSLVCLLSLLAHFSSFSFAFFVLWALILLYLFFFGFAFFCCSHVGCKWFWVLFWVFLGRLFWVFIKALGEYSSCYFLGLPWGIVLGVPLSVCLRVWNALVFPFLFVGWWGAVCWFCICWILLFSWILTIVFGVWLLVCRAHQRVFSGLVLVGFEFFVDNVLNGCFELCFRDVWLLQNGFWTLFVGFILFFILVEHSLGFIDFAEDVFLLDLVP